MSARRRPLALPQVVRALAVTLGLVAGSWIPRGALAADEEPEACLDCHASDSRHEGAPSGLRLPAEAFRKSVHARSCIQCHEDMETVPHPKGAKAAKVECGTCHEDAKTSFDRTPHAAAAAEGAAKGPTCASCHPPHAVLPKADPASASNKANLPVTCGACHGGERVDGAARIPKTVADYTRSVHGVEVLQKHNDKAPGCTDCHPAHGMRTNVDPASRTFKPNIPKLCGTCHAQIAEEYGRSVHGTALAKGKLDSPACNDCHSEHAIQRHNAAGSTVAATRVSQTCAGCHAAERITRRYGLPADRVESYRDSYHGLADLGGSSSAANCASCHGFHDVLPSSDPRSAIHPGRLLETCSKCHQGATQGFVQGRVHVPAAAPDERKDAAAYWVRAIYLWLIPLTIGGMLLHNAVIFFRYVSDKRRQQRASTTYVRFRPYEIVIHASVAFSFIVLAVTGFALTSPEAAWVRWLASLGMDEAVRSWAHRGAAIVFTLAAIGHFAYVALTRHGRYAFARILPRLQDLRDARQNLLWHLRLTDERPRFDRWDYTMKVEYWALVWGGVVMCATGALLWFKVEATQWMPRWVVHVAERVHWYEAILAVLAIVVWHLFFVVFHPAEYPMNLTWLTGRKTEHDMEHAHPRELERLRDTEYRMPPEEGAGAPQGPHGGGPVG